MKVKLEELGQSISGDLHVDEMMRRLYATDASVYRELPIAVAIPGNEDDVVRIVRFAQQHDISLIPRAAGTSLAGQCVGNGMIVDLSKYVKQVLELNTEERWVRVQPGVVRDELNEYLKPHGLYFGPNTSTSNRCNIGGMVGNNSCGTTSIVYGSTRDHVLEIRAVLSDSTVVDFKPLSRKEFTDKLEGNSLENHLYRDMNELLSDPANSELIAERFPKASVTRRNTGYALDALLESNTSSAEAKPFNFCKLLCGSEGTLAIATEIKLNLVPLPKPAVVVLAAHFNSIKESLKATVLAMDHHPAACELMDKTILDCTKDNIEQSKNRFFLTGDPEAVLMVEFRGDELAEARAKANKLVSDLKYREMGFAFPLVEASDTEKVWNLRKAGLGVLSNLPGDKKAVACIEDTAVAIEDLPAYINEFTEMMAGFEQDAVYYAHAGAGELHLRPMLDLKSSEDVVNFRKISEASADLVKKYGGALSGEHGDGRVRSEFIPRVMGEEVYQLFKQVKSSWDPQNIFNPGKIVNAEAMDTHLRYEADRQEPEINTVFDFEGGILRTVEKCNGSGDCRKLNFAGGTMCPSYRVTLDEKDSTRGRANLLREFLTMNVKENPFDHPEIKEAMDLCISCKGCTSECPSNVDMASLKSEFQYQYYKSNKRPFRDKLIGKNARINNRLHKIAPLTNDLSNLGPVKKMLGIHPKRSLPKLKRQTFYSWFKKHQQPVCNGKLLLFCDEYTNFYDVELGKKTVLFLNKLGYEVKVVDNLESGRAFLSKGFLSEARDIAIRQVELYSDLVSVNLPLIGIEPSAILSFRDEYPNLVPDQLRGDATKLARHVLLLDEFLSEQIDKGKIRPSQFDTKSRHIYLHGHCHQKALSTLEHTLKILSLPKGNSVEEIPSGCCGMAGSFGYEREHYELSQQIGRQVLFPAVLAAGESAIIAAPGTSCRHQIKDGTKKQPIHPVEILFDALL